MAHVDAGQRAPASGTPLGERVAQVLVERGDAVVVERGGAGAEDRHVCGLLAEGLAVADELAGDVAQGVLGAAALELVDRDRVGEVEHVDLLQLGGGAELRRHHVERGVDEGHDRGVALADARGLDDDEVEARGLHDGDDVGEVRGHLVRPAGGEAAEEDAVTVEGVGPDPVAEQRATALATCRVDRDDTDAQLVLLVDPEAADQLVGEADLPEPPVPVMPRTGVVRAAAACWMRASVSSSSCPVSAPVMARAMASRSPASTASTSAGASPTGRSRSRRPRS